VTFVVLEVVVRVVVVVVVVVVVQAVYNIEQIQSRTVGNNMGAMLSQHYPSLPF